MNLYIFNRIMDGRPVFYPLELNDDREAIANAECNPGTTFVECALTGRPVWVAREMLDSSKQQSEEV